jgi:hypothetical protein
MTNVGFREISKSPLRFRFFGSTVALGFQSRDQIGDFDILIGSNGSGCICAGFCTDFNFGNSFDAFKCSLHFFWTTRGSPEARHIKSDGL